MEHTLANGSTHGAHITELMDRVSRIEANLKDVLERGSKAHSINNASVYAELDGSSSDLPNEFLDELDPVHHRTYKPEIRICNFVQFKNYFSEEDASFACDVLFSDSLCDRDYLEEERLRSRLDEYGVDGSPAGRRKMQNLIRESERSSRALRNEQGESNWIQRIRIQAPILLEVLSRAHGESWTNAPRVYNRPFCALIHHHAEVDRALKELDLQIKKQVHTEDGSNDPENAHVRTTAEVNMLRDDSLNDLRANRDILRAYVDFIASKVIPEAEQYKNMKYSDNGAIRFSDLCYLFSAGDFLHRPADGEKVGEYRRSRVGQRLWKITRVIEPDRYEYLLANGHQSTQIPRSDDHHRNDFCVEAFHIDYTGEEFCAVQHNFYIPPYQGKRSINSLPFFPRRFAHDCEAFSLDAIENGKKVLRHIASKHAFYDDWTVTRSPQDGPVIDENNKELRHPEHIHSEVMVDFREAFQFCPSWQPARSVLKPETPTKARVNDPFPLRRWSSKERHRLLHDVREIVHSRTDVHSLQRNKFVKSDAFLDTVARNDQRGMMTHVDALGDDEVQLLHCRVFAYVFRERKFAQLDAVALKPAFPNPAALDALKIPSESKRLIQRSVEGYFLNKRSYKPSDVTGPREDSTQDVISGKGAGLFILLHGVPGVGKTMTAEAIAQANGKPLFKITCGDIGLTPTEVESSLRGIFRLASVWDCILLMDEVDTFFSQRTKGDQSVTKNALVSVFLRVLDYYNGILFLTTNRAGTLDEAFKSRIHYKIYYKPLSREQTLDIWRHNIERLRKINRQVANQRSIEIFENDIIMFAGDQYDRCMQKRHSPWSGRQIRNAFQVARSLAHYDATKAMVDADHPSGPPAVLNREYFCVVHDITEQFDTYMRDVHGMDDVQMAREMEHRADDHVRENERVDRSSFRDDYENPIVRGQLVRSTVDFETSISGRRRNSSIRGNLPSLSVSAIGSRTAGDNAIPPPGSPYGLEDPARLRQSQVPPRYGAPEAYGNEGTFQNSPPDTRSRTMYGVGSVTRSASNATAGLSDGRDVRRQGEYDSGQQYVDSRGQWG